MSTDRLLELMKIGPEDLAANRAGRLGPHQRTNQRHQGYGFLAVGLVLDYLLLKWGFIDGLREDAGAVANWLAPLVLGILVGGFFTAVGVVMLMSGRKNLGVTSVTGPVTVFVQRIGPHQGSQLKLRVGDHVFGLPISLRSKLSRYRDALTDQPYTVYVRGRTAVGIEPASS
ncbi:MAG: hypothetical protein QOJ72_2539 [Nocardioidaceae bacterium]|jgi:hypothetical protein|nr:hypothetical protein [Nocardioidaceae bacterium]